MASAILWGKPDAGNPHVRFDEGEVASYPPTVGRPEGVAMRGAKPRRGSLLYRRGIFAVVLALSGTVFAETSEVSFSKPVQRWLWGGFGSTTPRRRCCR